MAGPDVSPWGSSATSSSLRKVVSKLGYLDAFALLVSMEIGSGIFASTSQVNKNAAGPGYALILWLICGLLAWCGATCFAELGVTLPLNGGMQEYLRYIYGDGLAFTTSWIWILAVKPCSIAIQSITFAQYWVNVIGSGASSPGSSVNQNGWQTRVLALAGLYVVTLLNVISLNASANMMRFFTIAKITAMVLLLVFAIMSAGFHVHQGKGDLPTDWYTKNWFGVSNPAWNGGVWDVLGKSTIGIYAGLWAFSGYDSANMVAGDIKDPGKNLPRALHTAQPLVITSYIVANICYYVTVAWAEIDANNAIAVSVGNSVCGWIGGVAFAILVSLACLGSVSVNVFTVSRLVVSASEANWLPRYLGQYSSLFRSKSSRHQTSGTTEGDGAQQPLLAALPSVMEEEAKEGHEGTPVRAMVFNAILSTIFIALGTFSSLVTFISLCEYTFFSISALGILILRRREPDLHRPYKPFIGIPFTFSVVGTCLIVVGVFQAPVQACVLAVLVVAGYVRLYTASKLRGNKAPGENGQHVE